jgi:hypothetical protein
MKNQKCKCCGESYIPKRIYNQKYCSNKECQAESNRESSRKYRKKMKNDTKYKEANKACVKRHRKENPEYSKKYRNKSPKSDVLSDITLSQIKHQIDVLSDVAIRQNIIFKGLTATLQNVLSDSIDEIINQYYIRGSELSKDGSQQLTEIINGKTFSHSKSETKNPSQI